MKRIQQNSWKVKKLLLALAFLTCSIAADAQSNSGFIIRSIAASPIRISDQLTTHLIFPQAVRSVDRGNRNILVQRADQTENILRIKAESSDLQNSNLTVITADGKFYSFEVGYSEHPDKLNLKISPVIDNDLASFQENMPSEASMVETGKLVAIKNRSVKSIRHRKHRTGLSVSGIYIENDLLYFQLRLENLTNITYDIEQFRFFIRDIKKGKRTASQELEQIPVKIIGNTDQIPALSTQTIVVALSKFTVPDQKHMVIELMEERGGRHLKIKVKNRHIIRAAQVE